MYFIGYKEQKILSRMVWGSWEDRCIDICYNFKQDMTDQEVDIKREGKVIYPEDKSNIPFISHKIVALINRLFVDVYYAKGGEDFGYHSEICEAVDKMVSVYDGPPMGINYKFVVQSQPYDPWRLYPIESDIYNRWVSEMILDVEITKENGLRYKLFSIIDYFSDYPKEVWVKCNTGDILNLCTMIKEYRCICLVDRFDCSGEAYNYDSYTETESDDG